MTAMVNRPETSMRVPAVGNQSKWNVRLGSGSPAGPRMSRPGHPTRVVHGDPARRSATAGSWTIENTARIRRYGTYARTELALAQPGDVGQCRDGDRERAEGHG